MLIRDAIPLIVAASADLLAKSGHAKAAGVASRLDQHLHLRPIKDPEALHPLVFLRAASEKCQPTSLAEVLSTVGPQLPWTGGNRELPPSISGKNMFVELIGPHGPLVCSEMKFGLYLQAPFSFYPPHSHSAEELYYLLSGTVEWQKDAEGFSFVSAPKLIHHQPWQRHAMRTGADPLLAIWVWVGDIRESTYAIDLV